MTDKKTAEAAVKAAEKAHVAAEKKANDAHAKWYAAQREERLAYHALRAAQADPALVDIDAELAAMLPALRTNQHVDGNPRNNELANVTVEPRQPVPAAPPEPSPLAPPLTTPPTPAEPQQPEVPDPELPWNAPVPEETEAELATEEKPKRKRRTKAEIALDAAAQAVAAPQPPEAPARPQYAPDGTLIEPQPAFTPPF